MKIKEKNDGFVLILENIFLNFLFRLDKISYFCRNITIN